MINNKIQRKQSLSEIISPYTVINTNFVLDFSLVYLKGSIFQYASVNSHNIVFDARIHSNDSESLCAWEKNHYFIRWIINSSDNIVSSDETMARLKIVFQDIIR